MFKRKRNDSDDDEPTFGRQILPVANLPEDFNGTPVDGPQYLFTVRRDARYLPQVTRVVNPYESREVLPADLVVKPRHPALPSDEWRKSFEKHYNNFRKNVVQPVINVQFTQNAGHRLMPDKRERDHWWAFIAGRPESEWNPPQKSKQISASQRRHGFGKGMRGFSDSDTIDDPPPQETWFINGEGEVAKVETLAVDDPTPQETWFINEEGEVEMVPKVSNLAGTPTPQDSPEDDQGISPRSQLTENSEIVAREPTPSLMRHIDHRMSLHLLRHFTYWINVHVEHPDPPFSHLTETHARWIFALLSRVEDLITGDDMSLLRNLARAALALVKRLIQKRSTCAQKEELADFGSGEGVQETEVLMSERSCWLIISSVVGVWGQRDLWSDAETMLANLES